MIKPPTPENEKDRLLALSRYNIVDTLPEEDYDNITRLACLICNTPISSVTLIDSTRQFHKSYHGLDENQGSRDFSFCAHAINSPDEMMIVPDSRKDIRFSDNPLVTGDPQVIFYSGIPLVTEDGFALGTLCVIDNKPNSLNDDQKNALKSLGKQVIRLLELRLKNELLLSSQKALELYSREMEMFAYVASHDLKEPLRMVKSFTVLFEKKYGDQLDENGKKYIRFAIDGASRMDIIMDDLLNYFSAGSTIEVMEPVNLNEVINEIKELFKLVIEEKNVTIITDELPVINITATGIRHVFQNLIGNAIKYHSKEESPEIMIHSNSTDKHWQFSITDNGIGIDKENFESIFTIFKRLHRKTEYQGTGIGLALVKKIVEQNEGRIWLESEPGKGSTFFFTIKKR